LSSRGFAAGASEFLILNCVSTSIPTLSFNHLETLVGVSSFVPKIGPPSILPQNLIEPESRPNLSYILMAPPRLGNPLQITSFLAPLLLVPPHFTPEAQRRIDLVLLTVDRPPTWTAPREATQSHVTWRYDKARSRVHAGIDILQFAFPILVAPATIPSCPRYFSGVTSKFPAEGTSLRPRSSYSD
jgi:hypothetical protein